VGFWAGAFLDVWGAAVPQQGFWGPESGGWRQPPGIANIGVVFCMAKGQVRISLRVLWAFLGRSGFGIRPIDKFFSRFYLGRPSGAFHPGNPSLEVGGFAPHLKLWASRREAAIWTPPTSGFESNFSMGWLAARGSPNKMEIPGPGLANPPKVGMLRAPVANQLLVQIWFDFELFVANPSFEIHPNRPDSAPIAVVLGG
jgi:hypothetical protein